MRISRKATDRGSYQRKTKKAVGQERQGTHGGSERNSGAELRETALDLTKPHSLIQYPNYRIFKITVWDSVFTLLDFIF